MKGPGRLDLESRMSMKVVDFERSFVLELILFSVSFMMKWAARGHVFVISSVSVTSVVKGECVCVGGALLTPPSAN